MPKVPKVVPLCWVASSQKSRDAWRLSVGRCANRVPKAQEWSPGALQSRCVVIAPAARAGDERAAERGDAAMAGFDPAPERNSGTRFELLPPHFVSQLKRGAAEAADRASRLAEENEALVARVARLVPPSEGVSRSSSATESPTKVRINPDI